MKNRFLYWAARALILLLQSLPLGAVARLGRGGGQIAYWIDRRHRTVALRNLRRCFGNEPGTRENELRRIAMENFRRLGENYACAIKTAVMPFSRLASRLTLSGQETLRSENSEGSGTRVFAIGHFGNFELYARCNQFIPGVQFATTYRSLRPPMVNDLFQSIRARSGCLFFERRTEGAQLRAAMSERNIILGLLADQHAGDRGLWVPFFGIPCSTSAAPALFARRYACPLHTAICFRTGIARWHIEIGPAIPLRTGAGPRPIAEIAGDMNAAFERAIRRDPANWFWVHNRWKPRKGDAPPIKTADPGSDPLSAAAPCENAS